MSEEIAEKKGRSDDEILKTALKRFEHSQAAEDENRQEALEDIRFCDLGEQWPENIRKMREQDGQPCLVINKTPVFVRQIVNDIRQIRPEGKARPVDSAADPETAEVLNGIRRAIEQDSDADSAYDWAAECAVKGGFGYWRIHTEYEDDESFDQVIKIKRQRNPFSIYFDPQATEQDGSDMRYCFVVEKMHRDAFELKWPKASGEWDSGYGYDDGWWFGEDFVRVAEYWEVTESQYEIVLVQLPDGRQESMSKEDFDALQEMAQGMGAEVVPQMLDSRMAKRREVTQYLLTGSEVLEVNEWPGKYIPIVRVLGRETDYQGEQYLKGAVREMRDPQRQYNYMRSAMVERIALQPKAPYIGPEGSFVNPKWRTANKKPHAYLEYKPVAGQPPPQRAGLPDISPGLANEVMTASEELKQVTGIYDPGLGARSNEVSGVAIDSRRSESDVANFDFVDNVAKAMKYSGKVLLDLIPKIYGGQRMLRIMHGDGSNEMVQVNTPYIDEKQKQRNYQLAAGRYDVIVDVGPSYATQRKEASASMLDVVSKFPQAASVMGDLLAKNLDWPDADEIAKRLKLLLPVEILQDENPAIKQILAQKDAQMQQMQQQLQGMNAQMQQLVVELQNNQREMNVKEGDLRRKIQKDLMDYIEGMTDLEIKANKDLAPQGLAY